MALALTLHLREDCFEGTRITNRIDGTVYDLILTQVNGEKNKPYFHFKLLSSLERKELLNTRVSTKGETREVLEQPLLGISFSNNRSYGLTTKGNVYVPIAYHDPAFAYTIQRSIYTPTLDFDSLIPISFFHQRQNDMLKKDRLEIRG